MTEATMTRTKQRGPCQVRSKTAHPCPHRAVVEICGIPFCKPCAREQKAYFAMGERTQDPQGHGLRNGPLVGTPGERMEYSRDGSEGNTDGKGQRRRVKVLVADDHTMFREGLASLLTSSHGDEVEVVGKTMIRKEAVALARETNPDVIIMQVDRTLEKAKDTLKQMREGSSSPLKIIILTMFEDPQILRGIMDLGANAFIHKSASVEELVAAVHTSTLDTKGEHLVVAMPQRALELSEDGWGKDRARRLLSQREQEILLLAARGMSNRKIASHLAISEATVKRHLANLYQSWALAPGERQYA